MRKWLEILLTAVVYYLLARLSLLLQFQSSNATPVWLPSGFAFAVMLLCGRHVAYGILTGAFFANLIVFMSNGAAPLPSAALLSFVIGVGNTAEALTGSYLLRKMTTYGNIRNLFSSVKNVFRFSLAAVLMCMVSSSIGAGTDFLSGIIAAVHFPLVWITWWLGDFSSILLITPLLLLWTHDMRATFLRKKHERTAEAIALYVITIVVSGIIFDNWFSPPEIFQWAYWVIPVLVWAAIRLCQRDTIAIIALCSAIAIKGTLDRFGQFSTLPLNDSLLTLQAFISIMVITKLSLNASIEERNQTVHELRSIRSELETRVQKRTADLQKKNEDLLSFAHVASHDLQEPLRKIQAFADRLRETEINTLSETGTDYFKRMEKAAARMQQLIDDLLAFSRATTEEKMFAKTDLNVILEEVQDDLQEKYMRHPLLLPLKNFRK
jgi:integral membrane sensor domain MASE1